MYCINCGKKIPDDNSYCGFCGTKVFASSRPVYSNSDAASCQALSGPVSPETSPVTVSPSESSKSSHAAKAMLMPVPNPGRQGPSTGENLIIQSKNDPRKLIDAYIKLAVFFIVLGIINIVLARWINLNTPWYSRSDFDDFLSDTLRLSGYFDIFLGCLFPFLPTIIPGRPVLNVFAGHVEGKVSKSGKGGMIVPSLIDFKEPISNISSVSGQKQSVILNMKDGHSLKIPADNAEEIIRVLRPRIIRI